MKAHNIMEDITKNYMDEMLEKRSDICTCEMCREDILAYVLSRIVPRYVTTDAGAVYTIMEQVKVEQTSEILKELISAINIVSCNPRHKTEDDKDMAYQLLMEQIKLDRGVDFSHYRQTLLKRRIALRMQAKKVRTYAEYLQVLIHEPGEYEELFDVLTINVSSFFRDIEVWDRLRKKIFPAIIQAKKELGINKIRIWSAGCANGEEPYSAAILMYELLEKESSKFQVEIFATDIDKESLAAANNGIYDRERLKNISAEQLKKFFILQEDNFQILSFVKNLVKFRQQNLIHDPAPVGMDIVLCRNVFIYFNRSLQEQLIMKFYHSLANNGYFVMGNSESMLGEARQMFIEIEPKLMIFQKKS